ncbi:hypothetical protein [Ferruginibacter profundus]
MKRIETLTFLFVITFFTGNCQQNSNSTHVMSVSIPYNILLKNMGEPTGSEIKENSFYMIFYHSTPFQNLELYSVREKNDTVYANHKITNAMNIKFLSNEVKSDSAVSYQTFFSSYNKNDINEIRRLIGNFKIKDLDKTKGEVETSLHGVYLSLMIYDRGELISVDRLGVPDKCEINYIEFFNVIKQKYFY